MTKAALQSVIAQLYYTTRHKAFPFVPQVRLAMIPSYPQNQWYLTVWHYDSAIEHR